VEAAVAILRLVEEHARHNVHADLLREAIDGSAGSIGQIASTRPTADNSKKPLRSACSRPVDCAIDTDRA